MKTVRLLVSVLLVLLVPATARAGVWYYKWSCVGQCAPNDLAIGGVLGARHHDRTLDLAGTPRLDLSQHCPHRHLDLRFVRELDPALERVADPLAPATVVVHAVRHADPLFTPRKGGLQWADPVECLLDLHEARLDALAPQFLEALQRRRKDPS